MNKLNLTTEEIKDLYKEGIIQTYMENKHAYKAFKKQQLITKINSLEITTRTLFQLGLITKECKTDLFDYLEDIYRQTDDIASMQLLV